MLNTVKGNMYSFVTHTWNAVKGGCPHDCLYCYMKRWGKQKPIRFDEKELKTDLGSDNFIFVGSSCDMWADEIPQTWIDRTVEHCVGFPNRYLFQSKNPGRIESYVEWLPKECVIGATIESNRVYAEMGKSPYPSTRAERMAIIRGCGFPHALMITIEPIMDFDIKAMVAWISRIEPEWVNIGANTNRSVRLAEPAPDKIQDLVSELGKITTVKIKKNLNRLWHNKPFQADASHR
uniref:Radical SAM superfamily protein n=1 Tax=viral metagenome TaxID=1070528 RepID=A0A6M3IVV9_9ZZZZ